jgi:hypothetical protein
MRRRRIRACHTYEVEAERDRATPASVREDIWLVSVWFREQGLLMLVLFIEMN